MLTGYGYRAIVSHELRMSQGRDGENTMKAQDAINKIKSVRTTFMGQDVQKYNYPIQIRQELMVMSEKNEIYPAEYKKALDITWEQMSSSEKRAEEDKLNK